MSARQASPYDSVSRKWLALAERRCAHVNELSESGRWRHYYTPTELIAAMDAASAARDMWVKVVGLSLEEEESSAPA